MRVSPKAETAQVGLVWPAGSSFDATQFRIVSGGEVVAQGFRTVLARPAKLKVRKIRRSRSLDVRITNLRPGKLHFKVVAKRVTGRARVLAKVRQSKR